MIREQKHWQFEFFDSKQSLTRNETDPTKILAELMAIGFANVHVHLADEELELRQSKKGQIHLSRRKRVKTLEPQVEHNRRKQSILSDDSPNHLLQTMGIIGADGKIRASMRSKFTQINEFLKLLSHALDRTALLKRDRPITLLDCGCGSSYLTLAVHDYLNSIRKHPTEIIGVDVNDAVIRSSMEKAERLGAMGLSFRCGTIGAMDVPADIVLALHACDTATDDAITQAIRSRATLLLSVPCCHKHLNRQLGGDGASSVLRPILRHGLLKERMAEMVTDSFRALALRIMGYRTDVVEFVHLEHTARNVMIRAVRTPALEIESAIQEYQELKRFWNVVPYIETALGEEFQRRLSSKGVFEGEGLVAHRQTERDSEDDERGKDLDGDARAGAQAVYEGQESDQQQTGCDGG